MLDIYEMQIFLAAAETGSFSEAGRRLQMSQPAVSQQIRSLETRLNVELFHRAGRHITLTELGHSLIPLARDLVNHAADIQDTILSLRGEVTGKLKLACSTTAGKYILPKLISSYVDKFPSVQVVCQVGSRGSALEMLLSGQAQLAITSLQQPMKDLEYRPFIQDRVIVIAPPDHPWAKRGVIDVTDLPEGRYIQRETNSGTQQTVIQGLTEKNMSIRDLNVIMVMGNSEAIAMAVSEGIGVAFISQWAAEASITVGKVVQVHVNGLDLCQQLFMVRDSNALLTSAPAAFWEHVYSEESQQFLAQKDKFNETSLDDNHL